MRKSTFTRWSSVPFLAAICLACCGNPAVRPAAATENAGGAPATDPRFAMITALRATGPHPSLGEHAKVVGRLIGTWNVEYTDFLKDGKVSHRTGELSFGWVLDGRVIQDLWIVDPSGAQKEREVYTDLFYFDPKSETWPVAAIDPEHGSVATFTGGAVGDDRIVLESQDLVPNQTRRWSFNNIRLDSLVFRDEASSDGGKTWRLKSEYHMKRRGEAASAP